MKSTRLSTENTRERELKRWKCLPDFVDSREVEVILGVTDHQMRKWRRTYTGPRGTLRGRGYFYEKAEVEQFAIENGVVIHERYRVKSTT